MPYPDKNRFSLSSERQTKQRGESSETPPKNLKKSKPVPQLLQIEQKRTQPSVAVPSIRRKMHTGSTTSIHTDWFLVVTEDLKAKSRRVLEAITSEYFGPLPGSLAVKCFEPINAARLAEALQELRVERRQVTKISSAPNAFAIGNLVSPGVCPSIDLTVNLNYARIAADDFFPVEFLELLDDITCTAQDTIPVSKGLVSLIPAFLTVFNQAQFIKISGVSREVEHWVAKPKCESMPRISVREAIADAHSNLANVLTIIAQSLRDNQPTVITLKGSAAGTEAVRASVPITLYSGDTKGEPRKEFDRCANTLIALIPELSFESDGKGGRHIIGISFKVLVTEEDLREFVKPKKIPTPISTIVSQKV